MHSTSLLSFTFLLTLPVSLIAVPYPAPAAHGITIPKLQPFVNNDKVIRNRDNAALFQPFEAPAAQERTNTKRDNHSVPVNNNVTFHRIHLSQEPSVALAPGGSLVPPRRSRSLKTSQRTPIVQKISDAFDILYYRRDTNLSKEGEADKPSTDPGLLRSFNFNPRRAPEEYADQEEKVPASVPRLPLYDGTLAARKGKREEGGNIYIDDPTETTVTESPALSSLLSHRPAHEDSSDSSDEDSNGAPVTKVLEQALVAPQPRSKRAKYRNREVNGAGKYSPPLPINTNTSSAHHATPSKRKRQTDLDNNDTIPSATAPVPASSPSSSLSFQPTAAPAVPNPGANLSFVDFQAAKDAQSYLVPPPQRKREASGKKNDVRRTATTASFTATSSSSLFQATPPPEAINPGTHLNFAPKDSKTFLVPPRWRKREGSGEEDVPGFTATTAPSTASATSTSV